MTCLLNPTKDKEKNNTTSMAPTSLTCTKSPLNDTYTCTECSRLDHILLFTLSVVDMQGSIPLVKVPTVIH